MKNIKIRKIRFAAMIIAASSLLACGAEKENNRQKPGKNISPEAQKLLDNLKIVSSRGTMFGHHDDTLYGIGWEGDEGRSDVQQVCGDYPAVISFDLGHLELGDSQSLDKIAFSKIRQEAINQYQRGGMVSFSWHVRNPLTGGDSWDVSDSSVVSSILPNGVNHEKFSGWLDQIAGFMNSLKAPSGEKIPVFFRPWHEHTGSWFWWGADLCTPGQYKELWRMTVDHLQEAGADNLLYAYSPGSEPKDTTGYLERYPGDDIIDLVGFDTYQFDPEVYKATVKAQLAIIDSIGKSRNKAIAITETGYEGIPDSMWWTETLLPLIQDYPLSYVLVWRNARERPEHYYAPYPKQVSAADFVRFYESPKMLFASEINTLYK